MDKILYFWLEVNYHALDILEKSNTSYLQIIYEDLFQEQTLVHLIDFMGLKFKSTLLSETSRKIDEVNYQLQFSMNRNVLAKHPEVIELMKRLGYDH